MAILRKDDRVLMCHRSPRRAWIPGVWDFPGGHIEPTESPAQTLVRELSEELGVDIEPPDREPDAVLEFDAESVRLRVWILDYAGSVENRCPDEHDELMWVTGQEAEKLELADSSYIGLIARALER